MCCAGGIVKPCKAEVAGRWLGNPRLEFAITAVAEETPDIHLAKLHRGDARFKKLKSKVVKLTDRADQFAVLGYGVFTASEVKFTRPVSVSFRPCPNVGFGLLHLVAEILHFTQCRRAWRVHLNGCGNRRHGLSALSGGLPVKIALRVAHVEIRRVSLRAGKVAVKKRNRATLKDVALNID